MYIAVILENYSQATEEVQEGLTDDDYDMYYEIWAQYDPEGSTYIRYDQLSDFLDILEPPLQIHKPNKFKIITMDIAICKGWPRLATKVNFCKMKRTPRFFLLL